MKKPVVELAAIALASALLTPFAVSFAAPPAPEPRHAVAPAAAPEPEPACVRKVKVVYAGYAGATGGAPAEGER